MWISRAKWMEKELENARLRDEVGFLRARVGLAGENAADVVAAMERVVKAFVPENVVAGGPAGVLEFPEVGEVGVLPGDDEDWTDPLVQYHSEPAVMFAEELFDE